MRELKRELIATLRHAHNMRVTRSKGQDRRGQIPDIVSIHVHPPEIEDRRFPGRWESDLVKGAANANAAGTFVERTSRLLMPIKLPEFKPASPVNVMQAFRDKLLGIAQPMRQSMTYDQGRAMAMHMESIRRTGREWRCTFVTRTAHGSAVPTKTSTDWCVSIYPKAQTYWASAGNSWTPSLARSATGPGKAWAYVLRWRSIESSCSTATNTPP